MAQHHRLQPTSSHPRLTTAERPDQKTTGKAGQTSDYLVLTPLQTEKQPQQTHQPLQSTDRG
ncbi:hypothetical protein I549_4330 [Mycobacterium avium subsp. avium 2285 (R)]|nr:hypothetical protein I549_4330 [Mycobacterium avium subsp. avium 2285 (R)]